MSIARESQAGGFPRAEPGVELFQARLGAIGAAEPDRPMGRKPQGKGAELWLLYRGSVATSREQRPLGVQDFASPVKRTKFTWTSPAPASVGRSGAARNIVNPPVCELSLYLSSGRASLSRS
jgi:hypothetical protein